MITKQKKQLVRVVPTCLEKVYTNPDLGIEIYTGKIGERRTAIGFSGKRLKPDFYYHFSTNERREDHIVGYVQEIRRQSLVKAEYKASQKAVRNQPNPFKVGDILHGSWGYDQTNYEFVQVVEVLPKSVKVRKIGTYQTNSEGLHAMSCNLLPSKDHFFGEPIFKRLEFLRDGEACLSFKHWSMFKWDGKPKYSSWYA